MIKVKPLITVLVSESCDQCNAGEMISLSREKGLSIYPHKCNECDSSAMLKQAHPYKTEVDFFDFLSDSKKVLEDLNR